MKRYIKPNTEMHQIELQQMIAATGEGPKLYTTEINNNEDVLGKDGTTSSTSLWDEEE